MEKLSTLEFYEIFNENKDNIRESLRAVFVGEAVASNVFDVGDSPVTTLLVYMKGLSIVALNMMMYATPESVGKEISKDTFIKFMYLNRENLDACATVLTNEIMEEHTLEVFRKYADKFEPVVCIAKGDDDEA